MKIICMGDSFTAGPGVQKGKRWTDLLGNSTGYEIINKGINGDTSGGVLSRLAREVEGSGAGKAIVICGANDVIVSGNTDIVKCNYMAIIHQLFAMKVKPVIGINIPCCAELIPEPWRSYRDFYEYNQILSELNEWAKKFAATFYCQYIDLFGKFPVCSTLEENQEIYMDGLHLTEKGHALVAELIAEESGWKQ